jgi:hypothetical protein
LGSIVFDCASLGPLALEMAVKVFGAERVMFGTDYPIFATDVSRDALRHADLSTAQRAMVAHGTARASLGIGIGIGHEGRVSPSVTPASPASPQPHHSLSAVETQRR